MLIMTYNIRAGLGMDDKRSLVRTADVIRAAGAPIVCLQEVDRRMPRSKLTDQSKWLGERLGMEFVFQPNLIIGAAGFGNAILTHYPIISAKSYSLTSTGEQRGLMEVRINTTFSELTVFCTHWGLDENERLAQAGECASYVKAARGPVIFCGDLNDVETSGPIKRLLSESGLHDIVHDAAEPAKTWPAINPRVRIDYILSTPDLKGITAQTIDTSASDHLPILAEIEKVLGVGC